MTLVDIETVLEATAKLVHANGYRTTTLSDREYPGDNGWKWRGFTVEETDPKVPAQLAIQHVRQLTPVHTPVGSGLATNRFGVTFWSRNTSPNYRAFRSKVEGISNGWTPTSEGYRFDNVPQPLKNPDFPFIRYTQLGYPYPRKVRKDDGEATLLAHAQNVKYSEDVAFWIQWFHLRLNGLFANFQLPPLEAVPSVPST
jgi:hypothetical protein